MTTMEAPAPSAAIKRGITRRANVLEAQDKLRHDKKLNAEFDRLSKAMTNGAPKVKPAPKRKHGRPKGGRVIFNRANIDAIPDVGYPSDVARALGIKRISVQQWADLKKNPLPHIKRKEHYMLRKDVLVKWLIKTKRYNPRRSA